MSKKAIAIVIAALASTSAFHVNVHAPLSRQMIQRPRALDISRAAGESLLYSPAETYNLLVSKGEANSKLSVAKTLHASIMGGLQVGIGGLLCLTVCGNMPGVAATNPGLVKLIFGALFPVCLVLVLNTGTQLYTGNTASMAAAYCEKKISAMDVAKRYVMSSKLLAFYLVYPR